MKSDYILLSCANSQEYLTAFSSLPEKGNYVPIIGNPSSSSPLFTNFETRSYRAVLKQHNSLAFTKIIKQSKSLTDVCVAIGLEAYFEMVDGFARWSNKVCHKFESIDAFLDQDHVDFSNFSTITFLLPSWNEDGLILEGVHQLVNCLRRSSKLRWLESGIITGFDIENLSHNIALSILDKPINQKVKHSPVAYVAEDLSAIFGSNARYNKRGGLRFVSLTENELLTKEHMYVRENELLQTDWSLINFRVHGRSYCSGLGNLCGARSVFNSAEQKIEKCINALDCAVPSQNQVYDDFAPFPQIDPRNYKSSVIVHDSCGGGTFDIVSREGNNVPISMLLAFGPAGNVIATDRNFLSHDSGWLDTIYALGSSPSLGSAVKKLNQMRKKEAGEVPFILFGDPTSISGVQRWPHLLEIIDLTGWHAQSCSLNLNYSLHVIKLPKLENDEAIFVKPSFDFATRSTTSFDEEDHTILVVLTECDTHVDGAKKRGTLYFKICTPPNLCPKFIDHVEAQAKNVDQWKDPLNEAGEILNRQSKEMKKVFQSINNLQQKAVPMALEEIEALSTKQELLWRKTQLACVESLIKHSASGLDPIKLWNFHNSEFRPSNDCCPHCEHKSTNYRFYCSGPELERHQWLCDYCGLIEDNYVNNPIKITLKVPSRFCGRSQTLAELHFDNLNKSSTRMISGNILVDSVGHFIEVNPSFSIELKPGKKETIAVALGGRSPHFIAHKYYVRAPILIDGRWVLLSRLVEIVE